MGNRKGIFEGGIEAFSSERAFLHKEVRFLIITKNNKHL
jgi:hypothetical protein